MAMVNKAQKTGGTCDKCVMAGPEMEASKRKDEPSTASPTRKPTVASMATRPWVSSASR